MEMENEQVNNSDINFFEMIKPRNSLEKSIVGDQEWQKGVAWGEVRPGHPEAHNVFHVVNVLHNIEQLPNLLPSEREQLRLIALVHDTFKYQVNMEEPRVGINNHAVLAKRFAEKYVEDPAVLQIVELHDEAFNAWRKGNETGKWEKAEKRLNDLISTLGKERLKLYSLFYQCDNETGNKDQACLQWFNERIENYKILL